MPIRYSLFKNPLNLNNSSPMAANIPGDSNAQFEAEIHDVFRRHTCKVDHSLLERDRLQREAHNAALMQQVAELTLKLNEAQSTITALHSTAATLSNTTRELASLRTQVDSLRSELDTSQATNENLQRKLDREEHMLADAYRDLKANKEECAQLRMKAILAKQTEKAARKKIKAACGMLKDDDDDMLNVHSSSRSSRRRMSVSMGDW
ncbi:hypothetical protein Moror_10487 [Moniliophthora roreri MCA 2997]|uniref:Uncharacterized protein n=2 Tax=Moniliophthora roreri TaxID=221103 RepID=V2XH94_MONRO|nr:hypothetical protein Moror_10487 [Moniliophthora roreri MCA 2997]KAI3614819.1 hypothetical protein WG66_003308 [Moniliophthora roreri]